MSVLREIHSQAQPLALGDRLAGLVVGLAGVGATTYGVALEAAKAKAREIGATDIVVLP